MSSRGNSQDQKNGILTQFAFYEGILLEEQGSVGKSAFDNVDSLKAVSLGEVLNEGFASLILTFSAFVGNSFNKIEKYGFRNLTALKSLEVSPGSISSIEEEVCLVYLL